jgi:hypothetical protein
VSASECSVERAAKEGEKGAVPRTFFFPFFFALPSPSSSAASAAESSAAGGGGSLTVTVTFIARGEAVMVAVRDVVDMGRELRESRDTMQGGKGNLKGE